MAQVPAPPIYIFTAILRQTKRRDCHRPFESSLSAGAATPSFCAKVEEPGVRYVRIMPEEDDASSPIAVDGNRLF